MSSSEKKQSTGSFPWCKTSFKHSTRSRKTSFAARAKGRDLSGAFSEHTWDLFRLHANHPDTHLNTKAPSQSKGLHSKKAEELFVKWGPNSLPEPKEVSNLDLFVKQFWNMLWALLIGVSTLSLMQYFMDMSDMANLWITLILYGMILVMCTVSWYQEVQARKVVRGFQKLVPEKCSVIRDGQESLISASHLVVGDLIRIRAGQRVPADARMITSSQLKLEASSITGESEPIEYQWEAVEEVVSIFEARNVAFNSSLCVEGDGIGVVIRTGTNTVIGQIADMTTGQSQKESRLEKQVQKYVKFLVLLACSVGLVAFLIGGFVYKWKNVISLMANGFLVCAIGMVPCGLPATVTSILTVNARRMAKKSVYLKRLDICEALGQVNIIASDKTGTLTKNVMSITQLWIHNRVINGLAPKNEVEKDGPIKDMIACMVVCNSANYINAQKTMVSVGGLATVENGTATTGVVRKLGGSPSEVAMVQYAEQLVDFEAIREQHNKVFEIPFNSKRKWHLVIIKLEKKGEYKLLVKGASEILIQRCQRILISNDGEELVLDGQRKEAFQLAYNKFANEGRRVIGFAQRVFTAKEGTVFKAEEENFPINDLTFIGTCAIMDPPRDETAKAISQCFQAGIKVFMVTGDHHSTAAAISKEIGLIDPNSPNPNSYEIIHGERIPNLTDAQWDSILQKRSLVFSRTTPEQKLRIVEECQKRDLLIAMTGDGVNDSPALKKADIGIAMGSGSEVAKQAADIVLMDDDFSSIVKAVEGGRVMFDNIKKLLAYTMPHSFPEVWPILVHFCMGFPVGITAMQILFIDLGTELLPGMSLSNEPAEGDVMRRPPRRREKVLVSNTLLAYAYTYMGQIQSLGCFLSYLYVFHSHGIHIPDLWMSALTSWNRHGAVFHSNGRSFSVDEQLMIGAEATSAWQMGIVFGQFFNIWSARTRRTSLFSHGFFSNKSLLVALAVEMCLILSYVYMPGLNSFLGGAPIPWQCWAIVAVVGMGMVIFNEGRKWMIRRYANGNKCVKMFKW